MWICKKDHDGLVKRIDIKEEIIKEYAARNDFYKKEFERVEKELLRTRRELWALEKEREKELGLTNHFLIREAKENKELENDLERTRKMLWNLQTECDEKDIYRKLCHKSQMCNALKLKNKELEQELKEAYETISQLEKEKDGFHQDSVNIYGRMIDLNKEKKGLEKELKEAYETISQLEKERKDIEKVSYNYFNERNDLEIRNKNQKETIEYYSGIIDDLKKENKQLKERNNEQSELIVKQMRKLQKQETPDPLNGETLGAFYD